MAVTTGLLDKAPCVPPRQLAAQEGLASHLAWILAVGHSCCRDGLEEGGKVFGAAANQEACG